MYISVAFLDSRTGAATRGHRLYIAAIGLVHAYLGLAISSKVKSLFIFVPNIAAKTLVCLLSVIAVRLFT